MSASLTGGRRRRKVCGVLRVVGPLALMALVAFLLGGLASANLALGAPKARAAVLQADAADFVPGSESLPPGFRLESEEVVGGDLQPILIVRRTFVAANGGQRVMVGVTLAPGEYEAQDQLTARVNQLIQYQGWRMTPGAAFGDTGYRGSGTLDDGAPAWAVLFRVRSILADIMVSGADGPASLDAVARAVESRIQADPSVVGARSGFPTATPPIVPGWEPVIATPVIVPGVAMLPPGAEVTGSSSGSPIPGDTIVNFTVTAVDRPWVSVGGPRPPSGLEYITVEVQIDVFGPTQVTVATTDFWVSTFDGRSWTPVEARTPRLPTGDVSGSARGWLSFMVPVDQPALQLSWRLRTTQPLGSQGNQDQTLVVPLVAGATSSASVGTSAPPAGAPVVPPSSAPPGGTGPSGPSGPSAPTPTPGGAAPSGPGGGGRGGTRLQ